MFIISITIQPYNLKTSQPYSTILSKNFKEKTTKNFDKNIFQSRKKIGVWKQKK